MTFILKRARRLALSHVVVIAALGLFAGSCAPGQPLDGGLDSPEVLAVHLVPDSVTLTASESVDFAAVADLQGGDHSNVAVEWEATGGTITANGRYTAGDTAGRHKAIGRYRNGKADTAIVVIEPPAPVLTGISVTPTTAALAPGATRQFSVIGMMSDGSNTAVTVTWAATGGTVTGSGSYTAPSGSGTYLVIATEQSGTLADTAQVTVGTAPPTLAAVILTPTTAALQFGRTQQFSAVGQLSDGSTTSVAVTWTATGGTVSASGLYTAGSTAGTFRVIAAAANGLADTSSVTVTAPTITSISLTPASVSLQNGQVQQFSVTATLSNGGTQTNPAATWSATGGAINATGLYTAGSTAGAFRVIATSSNGKADTSAVTITSSSSMSYTTAFPLTENPISEGGVWRHTDPTLTPVQTIGGRGCGTQTGSNNLDDSNAYLTGFGANYEIEAIVYLNPSMPSDGVTREVELLLRWTDDNPLYDPGLGPTHAKGYEININTGGAGGLGRFKGAELAVWGAAVHNGDKFRARIEGQRIRAWWNDVLKIDYTDSDPSLQVTTGNPGIGFFIRSPAANTDFCFESATVTALP